MKKLLKIIFIIIGLGLIGTSIFMYTNKTNKDEPQKEEQEKIEEKKNTVIECTLINSIWTNRHIITLDSDNKPITRVRHLTTDYSNSSDEDFKKMCDDLNDDDEDDFEIELDEETEAMIKEHEKNKVEVSTYENYCGNKDYNSKSTLYFDRIGNSNFYKELHKEDLEYVNTDGTYKTEQYIEDHEAKGYKCEIK